MSGKIYKEITPEIEKFAAQAKIADHIDSELYTKYNVKRGLRDLEGHGVLAGLTHISDIKASKTVDGVVLPDYGHLYYRGYEVDDLVEGFVRENRFGYEETAYLLLFGRLPERHELEEFSEILAGCRSLPTGFVRDVIMKAPSRDMMNTLSRSVLTLYSYDDMANDVSIENVIRQCMLLISRFPLLAVYGYFAKEHYYENESLFIIPPLSDGSFAENLLHILRPDGKYTKTEAQVLDACLILHMDHGGGNNSTFTTHVVSSSMTDTYSVMAAALGSLKGPRHGGANIKVSHMFEEMKKEVKDWKDKEEIENYLQRLLDKEAFDRSGLIYGVGHAVYSKSDPRAVILRDFVRKLANEKGYTREYELYAAVETLAPEVIARQRKMYKGSSVNVDFYSGFAYNMLGLPEDLYTPLFAMARIVGWSAHRIEEISNNSKIIRPAYKSIEEIKEYSPLSER